MRHDTCTDDEEFRGMLIETRFFENVNQEHRVPIPDLVHVDRAPMICDVRGVDAIARYNGLYGLQRIPLQIKSGWYQGVTEFLPTRFGFRVPIIHLLCTSQPREMRLAVRRILSCQEVLRHQYDRKLMIMENTTPTDAEYEVMELMREARKRQRTKSRSVPAFA